MEFNDIPTIDDRFHYRMDTLRTQISNAVAQNPDASAQTVEKTLDGFLPDRILEGFEDWAPQKSLLEQSLIETFLNTIVGVTMEPERNENQLYQYALTSSGWCLHPSHERQPHFIKGESIVPHPDLYTLDELINNWEDIFIRDENIDNNPRLLDAYAPREEHNGMQYSGVLVTSRHDLRIVNARGRYVPGTTISYARTKAGLRHLFKIAEWLTDKTASGKGREDINDYLAALSRVPNPSETWVKAMQVIEYMSEHMPKETRGKLDNVLTFQCYTPEEVDGIRSYVEAHPEVGGFVNGRSDLEFNIERLPDGRKKNERRFGEIFVPADGNIVGYQIYYEKDYTRSEGVLEQRHDYYRAERERQIISGFKPWHWSIMRRLAPYFVNPDLIDIFKKIYEPHLSLDYLKK